VELLSKDFEKEAVAGSKISRAAGDDKAGSKSGAAAPSGENWIDEV